MQMNDSGRWINGWRKTLWVVALGTACTLVSASLMLAHDFWIEPSTFTPAVGATIQVRLRVGEHLQGDAVPRDPRRIERFIALGSQGETSVEGVTGDEPAGSARVEAAGLLLIGYRSRPSYLELEAAKFESYLAEEGLERITALRAGRGEKQKASRELYSRCAKSLLAAGQAAASAGDHAKLLGLTLELVPEINPYALPGGGTMPIKLLYQGQPLEGALVVAISKDDVASKKHEVAKKLSLRTDGDGRAILDLSRPGIWLVKAVHMVEAGDRRTADWESIWASLTFQIPRPSSTDSAPK